ncbi:MAG: DUF362 domain-containing protein [Methanomassiliicoccales archaeon]|nr:DUF362 domain-containing protein [Methanomassiliicoccales archaeon]
MPSAKVAIALDTDRSRATRKVADAIGMPYLEGKDVLIKPNFNTSDPAPGSTHLDTLSSVVSMVKQGKPSNLVVADRSGPMNTRQVFMDKGIFDLGQEEGFSCLIFDEMPDDMYREVEPPGSHWREGFFFARPVIQADRVICLCCLKTHQYGGHFTMSLKLSTGMVHRRNMDELHSSAHQREMIAEMNYAYEPDLVIMDGVEAFFNGGPMRGASWRANLTFASKDRVALDAVGVAALKMHGTTPEIERRPVFLQDQIRRAVELGLGVKEAKEIEIVPVGRESEEVAAKIEDQLMA